MASNTTELLPGQSPPLTIITATDQSGIVIIATALGLAFSVISLLLRVFIRFDFRNQFLKDDVAAAVAMLFGVLQSATVFLAVSKGFGKTLLDILPADLIPMQKILYSSEILYLITLWLTKCSVGLLFFRLSPDRNDNRVSSIILLASTVLMVVSVFIISLRCELPHPWIFINAKCVNLLARWQTVAAFDIITEVGLFATSIFMVAKLRLSLEKKALVIFAFGLRLPVIIPTVLRLYYLNIEFNSTDPTLHGVIASVCTQIQLNYAIVAVTTPCLRPFMTALSTNYGAPAPTTKTPKGTGADSESGNHYSLSKLSKIANSRLGKAKVSPPITRWDTTEHHASIQVGDHHSIQSHESKQMIISKNTEWAIEYEGSGSGSGSGSGRAS